MLLQYVFFWSVFKWHIRGIAHMEKLYVDCIKYASDVSLIENSRGTGAEAQRGMIGKNVYA
jgi:hypothetical protein